jgi:hypothetical protein
VDISSQNRPPTFDLPRGVKSRRAGPTANREREGRRFVDARVLLAFPDRSRDEQRGIVEELYPKTGGRRGSKALALQGYAASLFSTCGLTRAELHHAFLEIGWARLDERGWWRDARKAALSLQAGLIERGGSPPPLFGGTPRPSDQRLRRPGFALVVDVQQTDDPDITIPTRVYVARAPTNRPAGEQRAEDWATSWAVSRLRALAEPDWVADLFALSSVCRRVAVEAMVGCIAARAERVAPQ